MEPTFATPVSQKSDWEIVQEVLNLKGLSLEEFVYPERHKGQAVTAKRIAVIKELPKRGISRNRITSLGPYTTQYISKILQNGSGTHEVDRNLPFTDPILALPPSPDAESPLGPIPTTQRAS